MATRREREETGGTPAAPRQRRTRAQIEEPPIPQPEPEPAPEPEPEPVPVPVHTTSQTCVFCNQESEVDLDSLAGGRLIAEPSLGIRHYVCAGCNHA